MSTAWVSVEGFLLGYLLNSLWQAPLVFFAAVAAARLARPAGPRMEHRIWVGALLLEAVLPGMRMKWGALWQQAWGLALWFLRGPAGDGQVRVILGTGTASRLTLPWHTAEVLAAVCAAYLLGMAYFAGRLGWGVWTSERMRRGAMELELSREMADKARRLQRLFAMGGQEVVFASAREISGPATMGVRRQTLLLPEGFLEGLLPDDADALLAHEFAHMERWDFAKNLFYAVVCLPAAYHPLTWLTRKRLAETRELVCDAMAAEAVGGREGYARSLLRLAGLLTNAGSPRILHAIGILDANIFERRVMQLTRRSAQISAVRRLGIAAACVVVGVATCTSAMALRMDVNQTPGKGTNPAIVHVKPDAVKVIKKAVPEYPADAKKARIQGTVVLDATIGKDGKIEHLSVVSGPAELQQSALDAVRQWEYQPVLLNGDPVEVETTIKIIFSLKK